MHTRPPRKIDLGYSHFHQLRKEGLLFVDKSMLVQRVLTCGYRAALIPRPRRFGKTLNLSMLKDFFGISPTDMTPYFKDLQIWQSPEARPHFQKYPVIFVTFRDCKDTTWEAVTIKLKSALSRVFAEFQVIRDTPGLLSPKELAWLDAASTDSLPLAAYGDTLRTFSQALSTLHKAPVVILVDEYDTPIHNALEHGFYDEAISFLKGFLGAGFKDNPYLFRGVMTGILRVSKENMFSDLNNVGVFSLLHEHFKSDFGFTQAEVEGVLAEQGCPELMPALERMYNGYLFGSAEPVAIYNPWSTLSCIASPNHVLSAYWHRSGSPELLHRLVLQHGPAIHTDLRTLMEGRTLTKSVSENIELKRLGQDVDELFGFMLFAGYLKANKAEQELIRWKVTLSLVNGELLAIFDELYQDWFRLTLGSDGTRTLLNAVLDGDVATFQEQLEQILLKYSSFMDGAAATPEHFYQGLMLGLMVLLREQYTVLSNLETGKGRADLQLLPHRSGRPGVVMELKVVRGKPQESSLLEGVLEALKQLTKKQYSTLLESQKISPIHRYGLAFNGKDVRVAELSQVHELEQATARLRAPERMLTPLAPLLTLEERLDLEDLVLPHLTGHALDGLWLGLGYSRPERVAGDELLQWRLLLNRVIEVGQLPLLARLLVRQVPSLQDEPLIQRLRG